jgi:hypothetical protein
MGDAIVRSKKAIFLVVGTIALLMSFGLTAGGWALVWTDTTIKDSEGYYTTKMFGIERDCWWLEAINNHCYDLISAIIAPAADIDIRVAGLWDWGNLATFKIEGRSSTPGKQIFIGIAEESDVRKYLDGVLYDELTQFSIYPYSMDYINHAGDTDIGIAAPTSKTFWTASTYGSGTQTLEWEREAGNYVLVMMNADGSEGADLSIKVGASVPPILGVGVGLIVGGIIVLIAGGRMVYFAARRL